jgi:hypothetical protein
MTDISEDELYLMANLRPDDTGLPMVVWISERDRARHDVRVKVAPVHGYRASPYDTASVGARPSPRVLAGSLSTGDLHAVSRRIALNEPVIVDYWEARSGPVS